MPTIRKNKLIPIIAVISLVIVSGLFYRSSGGPKHEPMKEIPKPTVKAPDGDTTADTVRALTAEVTHVKDENKKQRDENQKLLQEREDLIHNRDQIEENVTRKLTEQFALPEASGSPVFSGLNAKIDNLTSVMEKYAPGSTTQTGDGASNQGVDGEAKQDMPPGLGFATTTTAEARPRLSGEIKWIQPLGQRVALNAQGKPDLQPNGEAKLLPSAYNQAQPAVAHADVLQDPSYQLTQQPQIYGQGPSPQPQLPNSTFAQPQNSPNAVPYFTIPENATLLNATAMTTILGRIPVQGNVRDPMEFKVLIGRPNLAANGLDVPSDVYGMVVTGTAVGDWNLQCVEGHIYSVTFLFADGSIRPISKRRSGGQPTGGTNNSQRIGYISDEFGTPCISGKLVTNAPAYLTQVVGLKFLETAAQAAAAAQTTITNNPITGGSQTNVTGDQAKFILGKAASSGFDEVSTWMFKRLNDSFDAIYVRPGTKLAVHINEELTIDKDPNARRLDYGNANLPSPNRSRGLD